MVFYGYPCETSTDPSIPEKAPSDIAIKYKGESIENISVYDFSIFNRSFKDLEDVELYFEIEKRDGNEIPSLISHGLYAPSNLPERIGIEELSSGMENIYAFKIKVLNKTGSNKSYVARFIFEGDKVPNISLSIPQNVGIDLIEYSHYREYLLAIGLAGLFFVFLWLFITFFDGFTTQKLWRKRSAKLNMILEKHLSQNNASEKIPKIVEDYAEEFSPHVYYIHKKMQLIKKRFQNE